MTERQISQAIDEAIANVDFSDWEVCNELGNLYDEAETEGDELDEDILAEEIEHCVHESGLGEHLQNKIKERLLLTFLQELEQK